MSGGPVSNGAAAYIYIRAIFDTRNASGNVAISAIDISHWDTLSNYIECVHIIIVAFFFFKRFYYMFYNSAI